MTCSNAIEFPMAFTNAAVEMFISNKVTQVTECNATDLSTEFPDATGWVSGFGLLVIFNDQPPVQLRPFCLRVVLRVEMALADYALGREALIDLLSGNRGRWTPYFRALIRFESTIAQLYQALDSIAKVTGKKLFQSNDGSVADRLNKLYNVSKHAPAHDDQPLWISDTGIECPGVVLTFHEIEDILRSLGAWARQWSSTAQTGVEGSAPDGA